MVMIMMMAMMIVISSLNVIVRMILIVMTMMMMIIIIIINIIIVVIIIICYYQTCCHTEIEIKLSISPNHSKLTPGQPVLVLTPQRQAEQPLEYFCLSHRYDDRKKDQSPKGGIEARSASLEADALTTQPMLLQLITASSCSTRWWEL